MDEPQVGLEQFLVGGGDARQVRRLDFLFPFEDELDVGARRQTSGVEGIDGAQQREDCALRVGRRARFPAQDLSWECRSQ
jgi:hypothetical protein